MYSRNLSTILVLIALGMLAGLLTGCGGAQSGNGSQDGKPAGTREQGGQAAEKQVQQPKIAIGVVRGVKSDRRVLIVKLNNNEKDSKPLAFVVAKNARIAVEGKEAGLADIKEGQQAQITYIVVKERNRAQEVKLFSRSDTSTEGAEKTG